MTPFGYAHRGQILFARHHWDESDDVMATENIVLKHNVRTLPLISAEDSLV